MPTPRDAIEIPMRGLTASSIDVFSPPRSVIADMIMVQFISMIVTFMALLLFKGQDLSSTDVSRFDWCYGCKSNVKHSLLKTHSLTIFLLDNPYWVMLL